MNKYKCIKISKYVMYVALFVIFIVSVACTMYEESNEPIQTTEINENMCKESQLYQADSKDIRIWTDPETNVQYVIYFGYGGAGGITPRINIDGTLYQP